MRVIIYEAITDKYLSKYEDTPRYWQWENRIDDDHIIQGKVAVFPNVLEGRRIKRRLEWYFNHKGIDYDLRLLRVRKLVSYQLTKRLYRM